MTWADLDQIMIAVVCTVISASTPILVAYVAKRTGDQKLADAVQAGAGVAYSALVAAHADGQKPDWQAAKQSAIANGVVAAEGLMGSSGTVPAAKVAGALGGLLAQDASVSATGMPPANKDAT